MSQHSLRDRIGLSTLFMPSNGESLLEALDMGYEAGLTAVDIVPTNIQGNTGYPTTHFSVGLDLDEITPQELEAVADSVSRFPVRNVHSVSLDLNIASRNNGIARESVRQFQQCAQLAVEFSALLPCSPCV